MRLFVSVLTFCAVVVAAVQSLADETTLDGLIAKKAAILGLMHRKANKALATAAQDENFRKYFLLQSGEEKARVKNRIDHISLNVQSKFHVEEMCLITEEGAEVSRIVRNEIADDLSLEESSTIFFAPGFAQQPRKVYVSPVYISPDVDEWVVGYVTPIIVADNNEAILHYEHGLEVYQRALNKNMTGDERFLVAVNAAGWIVSDSRRSVPVDKRGDSEAPGDYFERFEFGNMTVEQITQNFGGGEGSGVLSHNGKSYRVALKTVERWTLVAFEQR